MPAPRRPPRPQPSRFTFPVHVGPLITSSILVLFAASLLSGGAHVHANADPLSGHDPPPPMDPLSLAPPSSSSSSSTSQLSSIALVKVTPSPRFQQARDDSCVPLNLDLCRYDWAASPDASHSSSISSSPSPANPNTNNNLPTAPVRRPQEASQPGGAFQINPPSFISVRKSTWAQLPKPPPITDILARVSPTLKLHDTPGSGSGDANSTVYAPLRYFQSLTCLELAFAANNATLDPVLCPLASVMGRSSPVEKQQAKPQGAQCPMDGVSALRTTYMCTMYATSVRDTLLLANGGLRLPADWLETAVYSVFPRVCPKSLNLEQCSDMDFVAASMQLPQRDPTPGLSSPPPSPPWWNTTATNALQILVGKALEDAGPLAVSEEAEGCGLNAPRTRKLVAEAAARASSAESAAGGVNSDTMTHDDTALSQRRGGNGLGNSASPGPPAASYSFTYAQEADVQAKLCVFGCKSEYCTRPLPAQAWSIGAIVGLVIGLAVAVLIILAATVPRCDRKVGGEDDLAVHERAAFRFWLGFLWLENAFRRCRRSRKEAVATPSDAGVVTSSGRRLQRWTRLLTTRRTTPKARDVVDSESKLDDKPSIVISSTGMVASSNSNPPSQAAPTVQMSQASVHGALSPIRSTTPHSSLQALAASPVPVLVPPTPEMPAFPPPVALMRTYSSGYIDTASIPTNISLYRAPAPPPPIPIQQQPHFASPVAPPPIDPAFAPALRPPTATYTQPLTHPPDSPVRARGSNGDRTSNPMQIYSVLDVFGEPRVVQHAYLPQQKDEIELCLGDLVFVTNERENGWVDGINLTRLTEGLFPLVCTTPQSSLHLCSVLVETPPGVHPFDVATLVSPAPPAPDPPIPTASGAVRASCGQVADSFPRTASLPEHLRDQAPTPPPPVPTSTAAPPPGPAKRCIPQLVSAQPNSPSSRPPVVDTGPGARHHLTLREFLATHPPPSSTASSVAGGGDETAYMDGERGAQAYSMGLPPVMVPWFVAGGGQAGPHQGAGGFG